MQLWVKVVPRSKRFAVSFRDGEVRVHATEEPEGGRANAEVVSELGALLGRKVTLLRGAKSRKKLLDIEGSEQEVLNGLRERAGE
jgi:uncharacterized protein (TIGR00251 family)